MSNPGASDRASVIIDIPGPEASVRLVNVAAYRAGDRCHGIICAEGSITGGTDFQEVWAKIFPPGTSPIPNDPAQAQNPTRGTVYADNVHWRFHDGEGKGIPNAAAVDNPTVDNNLLVVWAKVDCNWVNAQKPFKGKTAGCTDCDSEPYKKEAPKPQNK